MKFIFKNILTILILLNICSCGTKGGGTEKTSKIPSQVGQNQNPCGFKVSGTESLYQMMIIGMKAANCGLEEEQLLGLTP